MLNYTYIFLALLYTTFIPGFIFIEFLLPKLKTYIKIPLYLIFSVFISTYLTYSLSLVTGYTKNSVLFTTLFFLGLFLVVLKKRRINLKTFFECKGQLISGILIYLIFFISLNAGIFKPYGDSYIMSGPNWQDTAMHLSIIENLSQGNFPPLSPYFSGHNLTYYYFADFHASIVSLMSGNFYPQVLILLNPFFASLFFLSVYALFYMIVQNKLFASLSGFMAVFFGNLGFVNLIRDVIVKKQGYFELLTNNAYHLNSETTLLMVPMSDYFLQNRPMMVGLPVVVAIVLLLVLGIKQKGYRYIICAGLLNAFLLKFQAFGFMIGFIAFGLFILFSLFPLNLNSFKYLIKKALLFVTSSLIMFFIFGNGNVGERSIVKVVIDSFSWGTWKDKNLIWFLDFLVTNFGVAIFIYLMSIFFIIKYKNKLSLFVLALSFITFLTPFLIRFTIYQYDMFKFFYYAVPFISISICYISYKIYTKNKKYIYLFLIVLVFSSTASINMLIHSYLNKSAAYSFSEKEIGLWIRENTPPKSVFITYPSVHSPVSDIAGRIRVLSYINWPYSHGFNDGEDNVFSRDADMVTFYKNGDDSEKVLTLLNKYNANYIYLGNEEISNFPEAENKLKSNDLLIKIYDEDNIKIFKRI